jgi:hypothetical protein
MHAHECTCMVLEFANASSVGGVDVSLSTDSRPVMSTTTKELPVAANFVLGVCDTDKRRRRWEDAKESSGSPSESGLIYCRLS